MRGVRDRWLNVASRDGRGYSAPSRLHSETVLRDFYDLQRHVGSEPLLNPVPLDRARRTGPVNVHRNPMNAYRLANSGMYRPRPQCRLARSIPDGVFYEIFAKPRSNRARALVAFSVSAGARPRSYSPAPRAGQIRAAS